jgi:hypothetical protein
MPSPAMMLIKPVLLPYPTMSDLAQRLPTLIS